MRHINPRFTYLLTLLLSLVPYKHVLIE